MGRNVKIIPIVVHFVQQRQNKPWQPTDQVYRCHENEQDITPFLESSLSTEMWLCESFVFHFALIENPFKNFSKSVDHEQIRQQENRNEAKCNMSK